MSGMAEATNGEGGNIEREITWEKICSGPFVGEFDEKTKGEITMEDCRSI